VESSSHHGLVRAQTLGGGLQSRWAGAERWHGSEVDGLLLVLKLIGVVVSYGIRKRGASLDRHCSWGNARGAVGSVAHNLFPTHVATAGAYALVGWERQFAGIVPGSVTSVVMIFETTRDYA